jgi:osmotically-inducible protein OsmY
MSKRWNLSWLGLTLLMCGCCAQDADCLARVGRKTAARFDGLTGGARGKLSDGVQAVRAAWGETALDSRVMLRLRWDKTLADADIQVSTTGPGVIQLSGAVADAAQKSRAAELARATQGVEEVNDGLEVKEAPDK